MLEKLRCGYTYRTFSKSSLWRNLDKTKPPEPSVRANEEIIDASMSFVPTEFDKKLLLLSGKYKTREEIPHRVRFEMINYAKSKVRIKVANVLMVALVLACGCTVYLGKKSQKEGHSLLRTITDKENALREEGRGRREE